MLDPSFGGPRLGGWVLALCGCIGEPPGGAVDLSPATASSDTAVDTAPVEDTDHETAADTAPTVDPTTADTATEPTTSSPLPVSLGVFVVDCPTPDTVRFYAETVGLASAGVVFQQETANAEPQWSDEHDLVSIDADPAGAWTHLELQIADGSTLGNPFADWERNVSTAFTCAAHITGPGHVMSWVFAVYDTSGAVAGCVAFGNDGQGVLDAAYVRIDEPSFDVGSCVNEETP